MGLLLGEKTGEDGVEAVKVGLGRGCAGSGGGSGGFGRAHWIKTESFLFLVIWFMVELILYLSLP